MKKFSKITGEKIGQEPKSGEVKKLNEEEAFRGRVMTLLNDLIRVTTYGPIGRYQSAGSMKITGKEVFLEALMDLLSSDKLKEEIKLLESLKSEIGDWQAIDVKIDEKLSQLEAITHESKLESHKSRLEFLYNTYAEEELVMQVVENSLTKITDPEYLQLRCQACDKLIEEGKPREIFEKMSVKYKQRLEQLLNN